MGSIRSPQRYPLINLLPKKYKRFSLTFLIDFISKSKQKICTFKATVRFKGSVLLSAPLIGLIGNDELRKNLEEISPLAQEVGRIFYSNSTVTINLTAVALAALAGFLCKYRS